MTSATVISAQETAVRPARWLLLIHQLPPTPAYLRVKVRRRLQKLGAQPLKNSVYVLPDRAETVEDFHWLRREILDAGGVATVTLADFVEGTSDVELEDQFRDASEAEYAGFLRAARRVEGGLGDRDVQRLRAQLEDVMSRDYFEARGRGEAERALGDMVAARSREAPPADVPPRIRPAGATWVTRQGVHVDRMASAWLIRRFIDPAAHFRFVPAKGYRPDPGELRFDMFDGEYTHEEDRCTFETLVRRFGLTEPGLDALGDIVHDIDCKVEAVRRGETEGVRALVRGICLAHDQDDQRLEASQSLFDGLYAHFAELPAA